MNIQPIALVYLSETTLQAMLINWLDALNGNVTLTEAKFITEAIKAIEEQVAARNFISKLS